MDRILIILMLIASSAFAKRQQLKRDVDFITTDRPEHCQEDLKDH